MTAVMVQGCTSWAGKSWLTTGLCRWYARQGLRVAPFKAQNMANNARVVDGVGGRPGGEIGTAQWLQAMAAGVTPDIRMNPVLVKPESWTSSQVIVNGRVDPDVSRLAWSDRAPVLREAMHLAYDDLAADHDLVVIEGAGSPAEINLDDQVNMAMARHASAPVLLVVDIDRGGAFAHLYGTWALMPEADRARIMGFVLNRFRGDAALLDPAPQRLEQLTGVPIAGVVPMVQHDLPDEDGAAPHHGPIADRCTVGIVRYPTASNLDEFVALEQVANVRWVERPSDLEDLDLVVLPGSKHVTGDAGWLEESGVGAGVVEAARAGTRILGICGGLQLLGRELRDPHGVEGRGPDHVVKGLGLLDARTTFAADKTVLRTSVALATNLGRHWAMLSGLRMPGYEIRHGQVIPGPSAHEAATGTTAIVQGNVLGILAHGLLEDDLVLLRLFGAEPTTGLDDTFDLLADLVEEHLDTDLLRRLAGLT